MTIGNKVLAVMMVVMLLLSFVPVIADADGLVIYHVVQTDVSFSLPDSWMYADRSVKDDNSFCIALEMTGREFCESVFEEKDYMIAYEPGIGVFFSLSVEETDCKNYSVMSVEELYDHYGWVETYKEKLLSRNIIRLYDVYFKYAIYDNEYVYYYDTVINGKQYRFEFMCSHDEADKEMLEKLYDSIIATVTYGNVVAASDDNLKLDSEPSFKSEKLGIAMDYPVGWKETEVLGSEIEDVIFSISAGDDETTFIAGYYIDIFSMTAIFPEIASFIEGKDRSEINGPLFSEQDLTYGVGNDELLGIEKRNNGFEEFYIVQTNHPMELLGKPYSRKSATAFIVHHGYMITIQYSSLLNYDLYYADFEDLVMSIRSFGSSSVPAQEKDGSDSNNNIEARALFETDYGIQFGMTPEEIKEKEYQQGHRQYKEYEQPEYRLLEYEGDTNFVSVVCSRASYYFDPVNDVLYQVHYNAGGGKNTYDLIKLKLQTRYGMPVSDPDDTGEYSVYYQRYGKQSHIDVAHWCIKGAEYVLCIDLWHNEYNNVFAVCYNASEPASFALVPINYSDDTGISFSFIEGWDSYSSIPGFSELLSGSCFLTLRNDPDTSIQYMNMDLWGNVKENISQLGFTREDVGEYFVSNDLVNSQFGSYNPQEIRYVYYNGTKFVLFDYVNPGNGSLSNKYICTVAMTVVNGYLHVFQFSSITRHDEKMPDFQKLLKSVEFSF